MEAVLVCDPNRAFIVFFVIFKFHNTYCEAFNRKKQKFDTREKPYRAFRQGKRFYDYVFNTKDEANDFIKQLSRRKKMENIINE
jgi:hypothetical protein